MCIYIYIYVYLYLYLYLYVCRQLQSTNFEAWTSPVEAEVHQGAQVISKRVDILLGSSLRKCKGQDLSAVLVAATWISSHLLTP